MRLISLSMLAACHSTVLSPCVRPLGDFCDGNAYRDCDASFDEQVDACSWGYPSSGTCGGVDFIDCADGYVVETYYYRDDVLVGVGNQSDAIDRTCRGYNTWGDVPAACR